MPPAPASAGLTTNWHNVELVVRKTNQEKLSWGRILPPKMLLCSERGLGKERHFGALQERPWAELNVLLSTEQTTINEGTWWVPVPQKWPHEHHPWNPPDGTARAARAALWGNTRQAPSATFTSCSAQNQQQKGHRSWVLAFKPLKMQQSSEVAENQQQPAWGASGLAQLCTTCPPRIRFLEFPPSALIPDPLMWPAVVYLHCLWIHPDIQ